MRKAYFGIALQLATQFDLFYEKGAFAERRLLCEVVFKRMYLKDGKIASLNLGSPFGLIASRVNITDAPGFNRK